jgi:hypothetical protein
MRLKRVPARTALFALGVGLAAFGTARGSAAADAPEVVHSVVLRRPQRPDDFVDETVIRAIGELNALGFDVRVVQRVTESRSATADANAAPPPLLTLVRDGRMLVVEAFCPDCDTPVHQELDLGSLEVNPEVAAIRSVETLRAALLEYSERTESGLPESFVHYQRPEPSPLHKKKPAVLVKSEPAPPAKPENPPQIAVSHWQVGAFLGPTFATELAPLASDWGWSAAVHVQRGMWGGELRVEAPFEAQLYERAAGQARLTSLRVGAMLRFRLGVNSLRSGLNLGAGVARYIVDATAAPGYIADDASHTTPYFVAEWASSYALSKYMAVGLHLAVDAVTNSPVIRISEVEVVRLGLPTLIVGLGLEFNAEL